MAGWSSGWVAAAGSNTDTPFSHNLNSTDVIWQIYVADNMEGLNASIIDMQLDLLANTTDTLGAMMTNVTDTSFSLSLGVGYVDKAHHHQEISFDGKFVKVVGFAATTNSVPGTGDLCSLLSADSGYQMFRNGLTIQWMSSEALIAENALPIDFPIPFSVKPFKVVASTRFPEGDSSSQQWIQVVNSTKDNVTVYCQSQNVGSWTKPIYADIIAIGIAEVVNCPNSEGSAGTKISNLKKATSLEDSDLFVISKEVDGDSTYDTSNNVTLSSLSENIQTRMGPTLNTSSIISWTKAEGDTYINGTAGFTGNTLPDGTWILLYFPWYAYDGGGEDDNAWYHQPPIIRQEVKGFNIRQWMIQEGGSTHYAGSNYTGHGIGFKISEDPV